MILVAAFSARCAFAVITFAGSTPGSIRFRRRAVQLLIYIIVQKVA